MARVSPLLLLPPLLFAGLAALFFIGMMRDDPDSLPSTFIGRPAPPVAPVALDGYPLIDEEELRGPGVKIVNFWASWCPPCRAEHPTLMGLAAEGKVLYGINFKDTQEQAAGYLRKYENPFSGLIFDPKGATQIEWGVTAPPETFIIGDGGVVLYRFVGPLVGSDYEQRFLPELEKALASQGRVPGS